MSKKTTEERDFSQETLDQMMALLDPPERPTDGIDTLQSIADNDGLALLDRLPRDARNMLFENVRDMHAKKVELAEIDNELKTNKELSDQEYEDKQTDAEMLSDQISQTKEKCLQLLEPVAKRVIGA